MSAPTSSSQALCSFQASQAEMRHMAAAGSNWSAAATTSYTSMPTTLGAPALAGGDFTVIWARPARPKERAAFAFRFGGSFRPRDAFTNLFAALRNPCTEQVQGNRARIPRARAFAQNGETTR
jgi:hypothetical protein